MDPGPMVDWPAVPVDESGDVIPEQLRHKIRAMYIMDAPTATEFILETLHMMLLQHRSSDDIARVFGVSISTVSRWRKQLRERLAADFRTRTPTDLAAEQVGNLKRTKAYAWQQAARCTEALDKLRWVNLSIKCEQELANIYKEVKVYKAIEPRRAVSEHEDNGAMRLSELSRKFLTGGYVDEAELKKVKGRTKTQDPNDDLIQGWDESDVHEAF